MVGVTNTVEVRQTVELLLDGMHSAAYEVVSPLVDAVTKTDGHTPEAHRDLLILRATSRGLPPLHWVRAYEALLQLRTTNKPFAGLTHPAWPDHIRTWDFSRLPFVVRVARRAGYLPDDDECWTILHANLDATRTYYPNWRRFGHGVIVGRMYWRALTDIDTAADYGQTAASAVNALPGRPASPWRRLPLHPPNT